MNKNKVSFSQLSPLTSVFESPEKKNEQNKVSFTQLKTLTSLFKYHGQISHFENFAGYKKS